MVCTGSCLFKNSSFLFCEAFLFYSKMEKFECIISTEFPANYGVDETKREKTSVHLPKVSKKRPLGQRLLY